MSIRVFSEGNANHCHTTKYKLTGTFLTFSLLFLLQLLKFYETMEKTAKLLQIGECEKGLEFHIAAVLPTGRRRGIMKKLFQFGTEIARESGYKLIICTCASQYTANLCQSLGWSCVYCLPYIYFEQDGERIFNNPVDPHLYSRIYVKYL